MFLTSLFVIIFLILICALYVSAEFAAVGARKGRIKALADDGNKLAAVLLPIIEDPVKLDRYISACQVGITISSLILGAYGQATVSYQVTPIFSSLFGMNLTSAFSAASVFVLISLTALQVILSELVPKTIALQFPDQVALYTVLPLKFSLFIYSWFIDILNGSGMLILRAFGFHGTGHRHIHSPEEIDMLLAESRDGGVLEPDEHIRLHRALQLVTRPVSHLMVPRTMIEAIDIDMPPQKVISTIASSPYTRLPVYKESIDNIIGIIHTKDIVKQYIKKGNQLTIQSILKPVLKIPATVKADRLVTIMRENHTHQAVVLDEYGGVEGLVTLEDVIAELMGEVGDELKTRDLKTEILSDGRIRIAGMMHLDDAEPLIGVLLEGQSGTVAGRIIEELGHLPVAGEKVTIQGVDFEVEKVAKNTIVTLLVKPLAMEGENAL